VSPKIFIAERLNFIFKQEFLEEVFPDSQQKKLNKGKWWQKY